ncbi:MAG: hypothetical protein HRT42_08070 [Campylobacteraceae bacterium]|nr:hypothetical protein [Campylobacteraceae bacterium]
MSKHEEEFNPWPSFVDIFSSVILVMLLFLLVVLVNLAYYAQFSYKVAYTGSISSSDLIIIDKDTIKKSSDTIKKIEKEKKELEIRIRKLKFNQRFQSPLEKESELISGGIDVNTVKDDELVSQKLIKSENYLLITYKNNEIFVDNVIMKKIQKFLTLATRKNKNHTISIHAYDMLGQVSATITKQISLARSIGTRNLIRKMGYKKKDVRIDLRSKIIIKEKINKQNGYLIIRIKK